MEKFAALLDNFIYTRSRNGKLLLLADYLRTTPDPDRGWAMAALTGNLDFPAIKPTVIRSLMQQRVDPVLFALSRDYVGDTAETVSLLWPTRSGELAPALTDAVHAMKAATRRDAAQVLSGLLDRLDEKGRFALLKVGTGTMRTGVSARLAKTAFAQAFDLPLDDVEELWHVLDPPYAPLFAWAAGGDRPQPGDRPVFRSFMLAHPLEKPDIEIAEFAVEWKWDGIRVQLVHVEGETRIYSRGGEDITASFPDIAEAYRRAGVMDGELLVRGSYQGGDQGGAASFNALQKRLGRKQVSARMREDAPAFVRLYDMLFDGAEDLRPLPWSERRVRLERAARELPVHRFDISGLIEAATLDQLQQLRAEARDSAIEGIMLKRRDSPYVAGRRVGLWYKWKRDPLVADCVLMYAQRGSGKRSSFYSDYTFGCWTAPPEQGGELVPVGKAYSGFSDTELKWIDTFVRNHTTAKFGPVREVEKSLVLEVAFDAVQDSGRHKSGIAMRFPRISRLRRDKPATEADLVATLQAMIDPASAAPGADRKA